MFEDSLMESGGKLKTKSKYWMIATFAFNGVILATMILIPLLYLMRASLAVAVTWTVLDVFTTLAFYLFYRRHSARHFD